MTPGTLLRYLVLLDRQAVRDIAACRQAVWLGLIFVLSAGFAREYDGEDLLRESWHLLLPLGASLVTSFLLFGLVWLVERGWRWEQSFGQAYHSFLGLYWMTAPLAWLYAVPVERFLSPAGAVRANLWLLAIVALWRVVLMVRVVSVLFRTSAGRAVFPVLLFADTVALALLFLTPLPVVSIMGGIRLSESEQLIQATAFLVGALGIVSWPLWLVGTIVVAVKPLSPPEATASPPSGRFVSPVLWGLGGLSLAVWLAVLPLTQPEQQLRRQVENDLRRGRIRPALQVMSAHERGDFPPHWDPPPRVGYGEHDPPLLDVVEALFTTDAKPWVAELFLAKYGKYLGRAPTEAWYYFWEEMDEEEFDRHLTILESLPADSPLLTRQREALTMGLTEDSPITSSQRERLRELLGGEPTE